MRGGPGQREQRVERRLSRGHRRRRDLRVGQDHVLAGHSESNPAASAARAAAASAADWLSCLMLTCTRPSRMPILPLPRRRPGSLANRGRLAAEKTQSPQTIPNGGSRVLAAADGIRKSQSSRLAWANAANRPTSTMASRASRVWLTCRRRYGSARPGALCHQSRCGGASSAAASTSKLRGPLIRSSRSRSARANAISSPRLGRKHASARRVPALRYLGVRGLIRRGR